MRGLAIGYYLLAIGYRLLAIGYCLMAMCKGVQTASRLAPPPSSLPSSPTPGGLGPICSLGLGPKGNICDGTILGLMHALAIILRIVDQFDSK